MRKPSVHFSQELFDEICALLADGRSLRDICRMPGMPDPNAVLDWSAADEQRHLQYTRARDKGYDMMADDILSISDAPPSPEFGDPRLRVEARKWLLSKALPKKYGDKQTIDGKFSVDWAVVAQEAVDKYKKKHES